MQAKLLMVAHIFAMLSQAQNSASIPPAIFENYKKGATQFISVIDYLLAGVNTAKPVEWAQQLQSDIHSIPLHFQNSLNASEHEKAKFDRSVIELIDESSKTEKQIAELQSTVNKNQVLVAGCERDVSTANDQVKHAENALASAERALRDLDEQERKAKDECVRRRRRVKRCWLCWSWVCEGLNWFTHSIDKARDRRNDARGYRDQVANRLNEHRARLNGFQQQLASSQREMTNKQAELARTNQQLNNVRAQIVSIGVINQGLKSVIEHVDKVLVGSTVLKRFVDDLSLLDLNTLIQPLEHISRELTNNTSGTETIHFPTLSEDQITSIKNNLKTLSELLPNEAVINNVEQKVL